MKKLAVDISEIAELMDTTFDENECYLDLQTGKTVVIPSELLRGEDDEDDPSWLPNWERDLLPVVEEIEAGSERYAPIPEPDSREAYNDMVRFARTVTDQALREHLDIALDGSGAFRRFKSVLHNNPDELQRWYVFKDAALAERVRDWLRELDVDPVENAEEA